MGIGALRSVRRERDRSLCHRRLVFTVADDPKSARTFPGDSESIRSNASPLFRRVGKLAQLLGDI